MSSSFDKLLFLPSGGLLYSPFVFVRPITNDFLLFQSDGNLYDSVFDYQFATIRRYVSAEVDLLKMATQDFFYIWVYLYMSDIEQGGGMYLSGRCSYCSHNNNIYMDAEKFKVKTINKFEEKFAPIFGYQLEDIELAIRARQVQDNIYFANLLLNSGNDEEDWYVFLLYIATQIETMKIGDEIIPPSNYLSALKFKSHYNDVLELYKHINNHEMEFGMDNQVFYKCQNCGKLQKTVMYDNIMNSIITANDMKKMTMQQENLIDDAFHMARFRLLNFEEYMQSMPVKYAKSMQAVINRMEFTPML
jgi:hypothetical protein